MIHIGIDPGLSGAIAFLNPEDGYARVFDMPTESTKRNGKKKKELYYFGLGAILIPSDMLKTRAYVEQVGSMPGQGVSSSFAFGKSTGAVYGALAAHGINTSSVSPMKWKKHFGLTGKDKDASRLLAIERWPQLGDRLNLKKHNGRGDALLIAQYGIENDTR